MTGQGRPASLSDGKVAYLAGADRRQIVVAIERVAAGARDQLVARAKFAFAPWLTHADAEELVNDAFIDALKGCRSTDEMAVRAYLRKAIYNRAISLKRHRTIAAVPSDLEHIAATKANADPTPGERLEHTERMAMAREILDELPEITRKVFYLAHHENWAPAQTCEALGLSPRQYQRHLERGRKRVDDRVLAATDGRLCAEKRSVVSAFAHRQASLDQARAAQAHIAWCLTCRGYVSEAAATRSAIAALIPAPALLGVNPGSLTDRIAAMAGAAKQQLLASLGRAPTGDASATATQLAASGGSRGVGGIAAAKLVALCIGGAGVASGVCATAGVIPLSALGVTHAAKHLAGAGHAPPHAPRPAASPPRAATYTPSPPQQATPIRHKARESGASTTSTRQTAASGEFSFDNPTSTTTTTASATAVSSTSSRSAPAPAPDPAPANSGGEFGP